MVASSTEPALCSAHMIDDRSTQRRYTQYVPLPENKVDKFDKLQATWQAQCCCETAITHYHPSFCTVLSHTQSHLLLLPPWFLHLPPKLAIRWTT